MFSDNITLFHLTIFVLSFALCTAAVLLFSNVAQNKKILLDSPTERKRHLGAIPMVGGLAIFFVYSLFSLFYGHSGPMGALYLAALWLMLLGLADDVIELSSGFRLTAQIAAALIIIYYGEAQLHSLGNLFNNGKEIRLERISLVFTVMAVLGVINAINMIDGIDGLSSGITLLTLSSLLIISFASVSVEVTALMVMLVGSILAFFLFNTGYYGKPRKVFMGDAGSTVLGFLLAWLFIVLSQNGAKPLSPVAAGWLFGLPLLDSISVMMRRLLKGQSPFKADRNHLHHQLLEHGFSARATLLIMLFVHAIMVCMGLILNGTPAAEPYFFWVFVVLVILRHSVLDWKIWRTVRS